MIKRIIILSLLASFKNFHLKILNVLSGIWRD